MKTFYCWKCGAQQPEQPMPLSRVAECPLCRAELHVCRMCEFFDNSVANSCREPVAERVMDKNRANFCGYLQLSFRPPQSVDSARDRQDLDDLEALFGGRPASGDGPGHGTNPDDPESLFKDKS
jgi:hypothetical protein